MADYETALRARLLADASIAAEVGTRIYPRIRPQDSALPAMRYSVPTELRDEHLKGYTGTQEARVQYDVFASTYAEARRIAKLIPPVVVSAATIDSVNFGHTKTETIRDGGGEDTPSGYVHMASVDLLVQFQL